MSEGLFYYNLHGAFCAAILKLDSEPEACSSSFDLSLLSSSQSLVPSGGPEIFRRNWIEIMWYVGLTAEGERGAEGLGGSEGGGRGGTALFWRRYFHHYIYGLVHRVIKNISMLFCGVQSAAQCRGRGETRRDGRQAAASDRSCRHLRLQQILQLHQSCCGLLRPLFNRYKSML